MRLKRLYPFHPVLTHPGYQRSNNHMAPGAAEVRWPKVERSLWNCNVFILSAWELSAEKVP